MATSQQSRVANIGAGERRKRLVFGVAAIAVGAVIAALLAGIEAPLYWRLPVFLPFLAGALGIFQARDKT